LQLRGTGLHEFPAHDGFLDPVAVHHTVDRPAIIPRRQSRNDAFPYCTLPPPVAAAAAPPLATPVAEHFEPLLGLVLRSLIGFLHSGSPLKKSLQPELYPSSGREPVFPLFTFQLEAGQLLRKKLRMRSVKDISILSILRKSGHF
jgi:hypothetical protein